MLCTLLSGTGLPSGAVMLWMTVEGRVGAELVANVTWVLVAPVFIWTVAVGRSVADTPIDSCEEEADPIDARARFVWAGAGPSWIAWSRPTTWLGKGFWICRNPPLAGLNPPTGVMVIPASETSPAGPVIRRTFAGRNEVGSMSRSNVTSMALTVPLSTNPSVGRMVGERFTVYVPGTIGMVLVNVNRYCPAVGTAGNPILNWVGLTWVGSVGATVNEPGTGPAGPTMLCTLAAVNDPGGLGKVTM